MPSQSAVRLGVNGREIVCTSPGALGRSGELAPELFRGIPTLSRRHFRLDQANGSWCLTLLPDARNLSWIDGKEMVKGRRYFLNGTHKIQVDTFIFAIAVDGQGDPGGTFPPAQGASRPGSGGGTARLVSDTSTVPMDPGAGMAGSDPSALAAFLSAGPAAILVIDPDGRVVWSSDSADQLLGREQTGQRLFSTLEGMDVQAVRDRIVRAEEGQPSDTMTFRGRSGGASGSAGPGDAPLRDFRVTFRKTGGCAVATIEDVTTDLEDTRELGRQATHMESMAKTLALFSLSNAFQQGDIAYSMSLLTTNACDVLGCSRVRAWLRPDGDDGAMEDELVCRGSHDRMGVPFQPGERFRLSYCEPYFDRVRGSAHLASEKEGSPVFTILQECGYVQVGSRSVLSTAIQMGDVFHGVLTFERRDGDAGWSEAERHFALTAANFCLLAIETNLRKETFAKLAESERTIAHELEEAEGYVRRVLPEPMLSGPVTSEWQFLPSEKLGGDSFGYHWIDDRYLALYVIDVVGHGLGAALLSVSAMNSLRAHLLPADFLKPAAVVTAMNTAFQMEEQNNLTFTMWYGIYDRERRTVRYCSAGHPPSILLRPDFDGQDGTPLYQEMGTEGICVGGLDDAVYTEAEMSIGDGEAKLYMMTDGAFEIEVGDGKMWSFEEYIAALRTTQFMESGETDYILSRVKALNAEERLPDDFCIACFRFSR